jgi:hypothetical protein
MSENKIIDYGPLEKLIGVWKGDKGLDVAPEQDGDESTPYFETITYTAVGDVTNAESQVLSVVRYHQVVQKKSDNEVFHDETGYWMWDPKEEIIMHSLVIPRAVCVLAGGKYKEQKSAEEGIILEVAAKINDENWGILQSPFMNQNARTTEFRHKITVSNGKLSYSETTIVEIYKRVCEHTDENELMLE